MIAVDCSGCGHHYQAEPQDAHRLLCGDARVAGGVMKLMAGRSINVAFTSPPYADRRNYDEASGFEPIHPDSYVEWFAPLAALIAEHLAVDGSWFVYIKAGADGGQRLLYVYDLVQAHVRGWGWLWVDEFCWVDANNGIPGGWPNRFKDAWESVHHFSRQRDIKFIPYANATVTDAAFDYSPENTKSGTGSGLLGQVADGRHAGLARPSNVVVMGSSSTSGHPAAFPSGLPKWFIRAFASEGDAIYDPFMGSGSTLVAAEQERMVGYGMELSPGYVDVAVRRWEQFTGRRAVLDGSGIA